MFFIAAIYSLHSTAVTSYDCTIHTLYSVQCIILLFKKVSEELWVSHNFSEVKSVPSDILNNIKQKNIQLSKLLVKLIFCLLNAHWLYISLKHVLSVADDMSLLVNYLKKTYTTHTLCFISCICCNFKPDDLITLHFVSFPVRHRLCFAARLSACSSTSTVQWCPNASVPLPGAGEVGFKPWSAPSSSPGPLLLIASRKNLLLLSSYWHLIVSFSLKHHDCPNFSFNAFHTF